MTTSLQIEPSRKEILFHRALAVANDPQAGDRRLPGQAVTDLADGIAGGVESDNPCPGVLRHRHLAGNIRAKHHQGVGHIKQLGQRCTRRRVQAAFQVLNAWSNTKSLQAGE
jgi:hypothetical protein